MMKVWLAQKPRIVLWNYAVVERQEKMGVLPGRKSLQLAGEMDKRARSRRVKPINAAYQMYRNAVKLAKIRAEERNMQIEGTICEPGGIR